MTKEKILKVVFLLSSISLLVLIIIQFIIYIDYQNSTGKNRAYFGLTELFKYSYRYYLGIIPLIGLIISILFSINKLLRKASLIAGVISLIALLFSVLSIWRVFI